MEIDELSYNVFYLLLRNEYKKKYELALSKCWTICVPCGDSLREVSITKEFVDDHVLMPIVGSHLEFTSTDQYQSHRYKIENKTIMLKNKDDPTDDYQVNILSIEKGYNKEFQSYNIIIVDKPIHRKYRVNALESQHDKLQLNRFITSYKEALSFLHELENTCPLDEIEVLTDSVVMDENVSIDELKETLQKLIRDYWAITMRKQSLDIQRDGRFQKLLSVSLEMFVMHRLHERLYSFLNSFFHRQNVDIVNKIDRLVEVGISPKKLGVAEPWANASMPSAIVEFATLETHKSPLEKLMCMKGTLEFILAEMKGIMADKEFKTESIFDKDKVTACELDVDDLIPLLLYVIIKCHPLKLYTDIHYIENFVWSVSPHDGLSYTLVSFKSAIGLLEQTNEKFLSQGEKIN